MSASSKAGACAAIWPQGATAKLEPTNTSQSQHPRPPTPTTQAAIASASLGKRDSASEQPMALSGSSAAKPYVEMNTTASTL